MRILYLQHGLGNQMFQYAYVKYLESTGHDKIWIDASAPSLRRHHGFGLRKIFPIVDRRGHFIPYVIGRPVHIFCDLIKRAFGLQLESEQPDNLWLRGYWQNSGFAESVREELIGEFVFKEIDDAVNAQLLAQIRSSESVGIHVRRGDYLTPEFISGFYGVCNDEYYRRAIAYIREHVANPQFFLFSDDPQWVKDHLGLDGAIFVDHNCGTESFRDMHLMSECKHNITANSSFSWWGAWLNRNDGKIVVAPRKWFNFSSEQFDGEIAPEHWLRF